MIAILLSLIKEYIAGCPALHDGKFDIAGLPAGVDYVVYVQPGREAVQRHMDGGNVCQCVFGVRSSESFSGELLQTMVNSDVEERFTRWLRECGEDKNLPQMPEGMVAQKVEVLSSGCPLDDNLSTGKFEILCRVIYYKKEI